MKSYTVKENHIGFIYCLPDPPRMECYIWAWSSSFCLHSLDLAEVGFLESFVNQEELLQNSYAEITNPLFCSKHSKNRTHVKP